MLSFLSSSAASAVSVPAAWINGSNWYSSGEPSGGSGGEKSSTSYKFLVADGIMLLFEPEVCGLITLKGQKFGINHGCLESCVKME